MSTVHATFYAVVRATRRAGGPDNVTGLRPVTSIQVHRITQTYPKTRQPNEVVVLLRLALPAAVFEPLIPEATITVPEDLIDRAPIVIEAVDGGS